MATHSGILAWKISWIEKPGRLQSMRWQRVRHDWVTSRSFQWRPPRGFTPWETFPDWCPCSCGELLLNHTSTGDCPTPAGSFGSVFCGVTAPFFWVLVSQGFVCVLQDWSLCFLQSCESLVIISLWLSRSVSLGSPSHCGTPKLGCLMWGSEPLPSRRSSLVLLFPICGSPTWWVWIWLYHDCAPHAVSLTSLLCLWIWGIIFW